MGQVMANLSHFRPSPDQIGANLASVSKLWGPMMRHAGGILEHFFVKLLAKMAMFILKNTVCQYFLHLGGSKLAPGWLMLRHVGGMLGQCWRKFGLSWRILGPSWTILKL